MPQTNLGLVCLTSAAIPKAHRIAYRTVTRTAIQALSPVAAAVKLREIYGANVAMLNQAIAFCANRGIKLYRMPSGMIPMADLPQYAPILDEFRAVLRATGDYAERVGVRLISHPDQFVVLSSDKPHVIANSITILAAEARFFDLLGLPESNWAAMNVHVGRKGPEAIATIKSVIPDLPSNIRTRLTLENDEHKQNAFNTLDVCDLTGVAMLFDWHHELVAAKHSSYDAPELYECAELASLTAWATPGSHVQHLSNGRTGLHDPAHSDIITMRPTNLDNSPWLEIEAKGKEEAISQFPW